MNYNNKLILSPSGWKHWTLEQDFEEVSKGLHICVPKGFRTDLASVPRIFWSIIPPMGRYSQAAVIHDWLCENPSLVDRKKADEIFYDLMIKYKTYKWKAKLMYYAVRFYSIISRIK
jgi:hypothetical protein